MSEQGERSALLTIALPSHPQSISAAREAIKPLLTDCRQPHVDAILLVTSELVTNAVRHARTPFRLEVHSWEHSLTVVVTDACPTEQPQLREPLSDPLALHGRGLFLVDRLSRDWGFTNQGSSKQVWAELDCR